MVNRAFAWIHGRDLGDILSGYRAFTRASVEGYDLSADGFGIETELSVACVKRGTPTEVVPVTYRSRPAGSQTNLRPFRDGARISLTLFALAKTNNPLFYFGSVGAASLLTGFSIAGFVAYEWYVRTPPVSHEALAVAAASGVLLGVQLLMFGVLSDMIVAVNREQTRRLEELTERLDARREEAIDPTSVEPAAREEASTDPQPEASPGATNED